MIGGEGLEEIERKKIRRPFFRKKKLEWLPPGKKNCKKAFRRGKIWRGYHEEKIKDQGHFPYPSA